MNPHTHPLRAFVAAIIAVAYLSGCASTLTKQPPGTLKVAYTTHYPDNTQLKEVPTEVRIVHREATQRHVAGQLALNVFMFALANSLHVQSFSKDDLNGRAIEHASTREHLRKPVSAEFVQRLQDRIDAALKADKALQTRSFAYPLRVGGGYARLVYETLLGTDEEQFRLKNDLVVYKRKENASLWGSPFVVVDCESTSSEPQPLSQWAQQDYLKVSIELQAALDSCEAKVLAALPELLRE